LTDTISFNYIKSLFDENHWDIGVLTPELFHRANLHPVKAKLHLLNQPFMEDFSNDLFFRKETNTIVLIRDGASWDYTHYQEARDILDRNDERDNYLIYTNYKEAAILAGLGVRAKNSLIYSYRFGFDHHIAAVRFEKEIVDLPTDKRVNYKIWNRCVGCDDCAKACPVGAIHNSGKNEFSWWLDSSKCETFIGISNHPTIPSVKKYWHENVYPEIPKDYVDGVTDYMKSLRPFNEGGLNGMPWNQNGYTSDGQSVYKDGVAVDIPICRECTSQPRCSKWNGKYPYDRIGNKVDKE
jgi:ferredoxin